MIRRHSARRLESVLFTDMVGSTERAVELGDRAWRSLLRRHHRLVRAELRRFGGREIDSAGDGFFATFPQPAQAVRCAFAIHASVARLGLEMRSAVHTGEVEPIGRKVGGVAVHLTARLLSAAEPDQVLVTSTVRELVAGSELTFADLGERRFKGFDEAWHVFEALGPRPAPAVADADDAERGIRPSRGVVILGAAAVATVVLAAAVGLGLWLSSDGVSAGPDTVVRINPGSDALGRATRIGRGPLAIAADGGAVWVASESGTVSRVDADDGDVIATGGVGIPTDLSVDDGTVWVARGYENRLSRVDAATAQVRDTIEMRARRVVAHGAAAWVADDLEHRVLRLGHRDAEASRAVGFPAGAAPRGMAVVGDELWVANEGASTLARIAMDTGEAIGSPIGLGHRPTAIAHGAGSIWVLSLDDDVLVQVDPDGGRVLRTIDVCDGPVGLVAAAGSVWVACRGDALVLRLDESGSRQAEISLPAIPAGIATDGAAVWVALRAD